MQLEYHFIKLFSRWTWSCVFFVEIDGNHSKQSLNIVKNPINETGEIILSLPKKRINVRSSETMTQKWRQRGKEGGSWVRSPLSSRGIEKNGRPRNDYSPFFEPRFHFHQGPLQDPSLPHLPTRSGHLLNYVGLLLTTSDLYFVIVPLQWTALLPSMNFIRIFRTPPGFEHRVSESTEVRSKS